MRKITNLSLAHAISPICADDGPEAEPELADPR